MSCRSLLPGLYGRFSCRLLAFDGHFQTPPPFSRFFTPSFRLRRCRDAAIDISTEIFATPFSAAFFLIGMPPFADIDASRLLAALRHRRRRAPKPLLRHAICRRRRRQPRCCRPMLLLIFLFLQRNIITFESFFAELPTMPIFVAIHDISLSPPADFLHTPPADSFSRFTPAL